jgi:UDP-glucose 4-epimerase
MRILVTGGAGYIGSHTVVQLLEAGHDVVVVDNLSNSSPESLRRVEELTGREAPLEEIDLLDAPAVDKVFGSAFNGRGVDAVIHFAGLKAVGESVELPLRYYANNISGTLVLLQAMQRAHVRTLVFSSSATVYGAPEQMPITEDFRLGAVNPYGRTKEHIEGILTDLAASVPSSADDAWHIALLRYFNPVGSHASGRIGEDPAGIPNNLMPYVAQVAVGRRPELVVHGDDYPTPDGTCVRDYVHVVDLARGHLAALAALPDRPGARAWNLGTGQGSSVYDVLHAFERAVGHELPSRVGPRRPGDAPVSYCDPARAEAELGWKAELSLDDMCADAWRWQSANPEGYPEQ